MPDRVLGAIDRLTLALERFRIAYDAWLASDGSDPERRAGLLEALADAERHLDAAREELDAAEERLRRR